jgi:hypothetical protein
MKQYVLILALAVFWGISGLVVGLGVRAIFGAEIVFTCALLNVIIGLLLLLLTTRNEHARRLFYEGPRGEEEGLIPLAFLWAFPLILVFVGVLWWLLGQFFR